MLNFRHLYFTALFAIAFFAVTLPAWANSTPSNQGVDILSWLGIGGSASVGTGIGLTAKTKIDDFLKKSSVSSSISSIATD